MKMMKRILSSVIVVSSAWAGFTVAAEKADQYPSRLIKIVAPYGPGGATDMFSRTLAEGLHKVLDVPVIVENKAGASGVIGADYVSRAKPDGYTLVVGAVSLHAILPSLLKKMDAAQGRLTPVSTLANSPSYIVVPTSSTANTIEELVEMVRAEPEKYNYGSAGLGTSQHMFAELFKQEADLKLLHIPYKGSGELVVDLISNRVNMAVEQGPAILSHIRNGTLRPLATTMTERTAELPDVPTLKETVLPDFEANTWFAVYAPKGTPEDIIEKLNVSISEVLKDPNVLKVLHSQGAVPMHKTVAELQEMEKTDREMWLKVIESGKIAIE